jgi:protein CpxP
MKLITRLLLTSAGLALVALPATRAADDTTPAGATTVTTTTTTTTPDHMRGPGPGRGGGERMVQAIIERVGLDADQAAKVKAIFQKQREAGQPVWNDASLSQEQKREKMRAMREESNKEIRALLTPEQQTKFDAVLKEMQQHRPPGGGRGGPGGQDGPPPPPPPPPGAADKAP